jgi:hypothetical protein
MKPPFISASTTPMWKGDSQPDPEKEKVGPELALPPLAFLVASPRRHSPGMRAARLDLHMTAAQ